MNQISIVICTRDRPESLAATLRSIGGARIPPGCTVEVIVSDNGPTDVTRRVVESASFAGEMVRYVTEPRQGHGRAYYAAIAAAKGDILLFTDDDVHVPANWIEGMSAPLLAGQYDAIAGGIVFPPRIAFLLSRRPFVTRRSWFASSEYLDPDRPSAMIGANMAFHRRILSDNVGFDLELGPGAMGTHQESLLSLQLVAAGFRLGSVLEVAVEHHFEVSRLSRSAMLGSAIKLGRSRAYVDYHWSHVAIRFPRIRRALAGSLGVAAAVAEKLRIGVVGVVSGPLLRFTQDAAYYSEYLLQAKGGRKYPPR